jgi:lysozyme
VWGAYHFDTGDDGAKQAEFFLEKSKPDALNAAGTGFEGNPHGESMTIGDARGCNASAASNPARPGSYGGFYLKQLIGSLPEEVLGNCWFCLSKYSATLRLPPNWKSWTLWQHTDGAAGPNPALVPGVGLCDRNYYCGTPDQLKRKWVQGSL